MKIVEIERKSPVLHKAQFGCLRDTFTLNVTRGCEFMCVYCYARGYPNAPPAGEVFLYKNLPEKLASELDRPRGRSRVNWVAFNTASDCFQTHPAVQDAAFQVMRMFLDRSIRFSFLTKGRIPDRFIDLFSHYPQLVHPTVCLVSVRARYQEVFEPHAATPSERIRNVDRLKSAGLKVDVRVDPIIPFTTDDEKSIYELCNALAGQGIKKITLSYLHLRPAVFDQLRQELPRTKFELLRSCFGNRPWKERGSFTQRRLTALAIRRKGYGRFRAVAEGFGISSLICACKNPDMEGHLCTGRVGKADSRKMIEKRETQLSLFQC
jgi:DNA repair photolyase